jgi:hypothetical protein
LDGQLQKVIVQSILHGFVWNGNCRFSHTLSKCVQYKFK